MTGRVTTTTEELRQRARAGDLQALQELRDRGFFRDRIAREGYAVSHAQRRLWIVDQMAGGSAYNIPIALELNGALDAAALRGALEAVIRRHELLRTTFATVEGAVRQFIQAEIDLPWAEFDLSGDLDAEREARRIAADHAAGPFDLSCGPPLRAALVRLAPDRHLFLFNIHHIVSDLVSLGVLVRELCLLYEAGTARRAPALEPLPLQYKEFAARQNRMLVSEDAERNRAYWLRQLAGPLSPLELPADFPRPPLKTAAGNVCRVRLDTGLTDRLRRLGLRHGMTLFMVLTATVKLLLHRYTGQEDIIVGFPLAGRDHPDLAGQIGCFVNTVALRDRIDGNETFAALLGRVRQTMLEAYEHQAYPFDRLVEEIDLPRDLSRSPVFDISVTLVNAEPAALRFGAVTASPYDDGFAAAKVDLSFDFYETGDGLELAIAYSTDLFRAERIQRLAAHYLRLSAHAIEHSEQSVGTMPMMAPEERRRILVEFNATDRLVDNETFVGRFERQVERTPDAVAVGHSAGQLSFGELNRQANRLARRLARLGVCPGTLVGLLLDPSPDSVRGFLGILKAGGIYLPLDPANPADRLDAMLEDAGPPVILAGPALVGRVSNRPGCRVLVWDDQLTAAMADEFYRDPVRVAGLDDAAYAIFTSGSTGRPKAAVLPHRGLANVANEQALLFGPAPGDRVLQFAALGFDASIFEMTMALGSGATLCLADREQLLPGAALLATLEREAISIATLPPSTLATLPEAALPRLRILSVAGEACSAELVQRWAPGRAFFNLYGPTEATIWASAARCEPDDLPPTLGQSIGNTRLYVLDDRLQPVPVGVPGELFIAGVGLARHYLNRPELTRERFVPDPFDGTPGARLYRTGDLARWRSDGTVEFLGRVDQQVKLRGYRIEPAEIEAALARHPGVGDAAVVIRDSGPGRQQLVAYATPRSAGGRLDGSELRQFLRERLPDYMVPARVLVIEAMTLTPNKKINRKALPEPDGTRADLGGGFIAPQDALEEALAGWFADALRIDRVSVTDSLFDLGADSLIVTRIASQVRDAFRVDITIPQLFRAACVSALAEVVRAAVPSGRADAIAAALRRLRRMSQAEKQDLIRKRQSVAGRAAMYDD